jgi:phenylacetate-CoA ligase
VSAGARDSAGNLPALVRQLEAAQWASPDTIAAGQRRHLRRLAEHCAAYSPRFARRLAEAGVTPADLAEPGGLSMLPVLTRRDLQSWGGEAFCSSVPHGHGDVVVTRTSGSTGEPVAVRRTGISTLFWNAMAMRELGWHRRNPAGRLCAIRANVGSYALLDSWGSPASCFARTGPRLMLPIATPVEQLVEWVVGFRPTFLVIYPSTLDAFTAHCRQHWITVPDLRHVLTIGETLSPAIRAAAEVTFAAEVADCYSSQELGQIAAQCPTSGLYHVMAESVIAEVLTDAGEPCGEGQAGRVVITDLHNYATPLVRYEIGDVAEIAPPCACGRGLPTWKRILGRERNLLLMSDGTRHWPVIGLLRCRDVAPIVQYQLVQERLDAIEVRLVVERPLSRDEERAVVDLVHASLGHHLTLRLSYVAGRMPVGPTGKFEEFVCKIARPSVPAGERRDIVSATLQQTAA